VVCRNYAVNEVKMSNEMVIADGVESLLAAGDIGKMSSEQRKSYYLALCNAAGLDPISQPFEYLVLNGKTVLYAKRGAAEQLRRKHGISIQIVERRTECGVHSVVARATTADGRTDESVGSVYIEQLKGEALSNAFMKAETKAKRRVTLSLCGLGMLDEHEVDSIPGAQRLEYEVMQPTTQALPSADREIALMEIAACQSLADLHKLAPRLAILAPKTAPHRADVTKAFRAREQLLSQPADPENDGR
jgi:hypothetical protein